MKVKELIEELQKLDPDATTVLSYDDDSKITMAEYIMPPCQINNVWYRDKHHNDVNGTVVIIY